MILNAAKKAKDTEAFLFAYPAVKKAGADNLKRFEGMMTNIRKRKDERLTERYETMIERIKKQNADLDKLAADYKKVK